MRSAIVKTRVLDATDTKDKRIKATHPDGQTLTEGYFTARSSAEGSERHAEVVLALMEAVTPGVEYDWQVTEEREYGYTFRLIEKSADADTNA